MFKKKKKKKKNPYLILNNTIEIKMKWIYLFIILSGLKLLLKYSTPYLSINSHTLTEG